MTATIHGLPETAPGDCTFAVIAADLVSLGATQDMIPPLRLRPHNEKALLAEMDAALALMTSAGAAAVLEASLP